MNTSFTDLNAFLKHLVAKTNTNCLTPLSSLDGSSSFLVSFLRVVVAVVAQARA